MKRPDLKNENNRIYNYSNLHLVYCAFLLYREKLTKREKERGAAAAIKLTGSLKSRELRCFGCVDFAFVCVTHNHI